MNVRRLSSGDWLAAVSGVLLLIALFLPWYSAQGADVNAWDSMAVNDVLIAFAAVMAVVAVIVVSIDRFAGFSVAASMLASLPGIVALLLVVIRMLSPAPEVDVSLGTGAWLGLLAAAGVVVGCWAGARDEGPARRTAAAEREATDQGIARAELLALPPDVGATGSGRPHG